MKKNLSILLVSISFLPLFAASAGVSVSIDGEKGNKEKVEMVTVAEKSWEFYSAIAQPSPEELAQTGSHKFGKEVAWLYDSFMELFVVKEEVVPGDPARRTVIRKPGIYNAVRSIEKELNKSLKNKQITNEEAAREFAQVLKIALAAVDSDSETFEEALQKNKKDATVLLAIFENVHLKDLY
ncbi:MAG: hypothetical protein LUH10_08020 [Tannerellaceae bacterium]|nr:hypothetical protein [Tannerellaceae bacterium]